MPLEDVRLVDLPRIPDARGNLTFVEGGRHIPFEIRRVFYLYDVPGGESRAGHALKTCQQFIVAMSGSFDVLVDDGSRSHRYHLNRSYNGLYLPGLIWRVLDNFSSGSVCTVFASEPYDEAGYFRDYDAFVRVTRGAHA
jgi:WxcM-like, C-terminal